MTVDLVVKNSRLVIHDRIVKAGVAVDDGRIVAVAGDAHLPPSDTEIDAQGRCVLPGLVDPHIHLGIRVPFVQDCRVETASFAAGGITSCLYFFYDERSYKIAYPEHKRLYEANALIDGAVHLLPNTEQHFKELGDYIAMGLTSFKFFPMSFPAVGYEAVGDGLLYRAFQKIGKLGGLPMVHCESVEMIEWFEAELRRQGRGEVDTHFDARPPFTEEEYMRRVAFIAKVAESPLYVVHVSTGGGLDVLLNAEAEGVEIYLETCPHYLLLEEEDFRNRLAIVIPPLRDRGEIEDLWWGLSQGLISCIGSDHITTTQEMKNQAELAYGFPGAELLLPLMLSEGFWKRGLPLPSIADLCSSNPARIFNLPRKGAIEVGYDGDLVIVDLDKEVEVSPENFIITP